VPEQSQFHAALGAALFIGSWKPADAVEQCFHYFA
jgi:hypothetical protein